MLLFVAHSDAPACLPVLSPSIAGSASRWRAVREQGVVFQPDLRKPEARHSQRTSPIAGSSRRGTKATVRGLDKHAIDYLASAQPTPRSSVESQGMHMS